MTFKYDKRKNSRNGTDSAGKTDCLARSCGSRNIARYAAHLITRNKHKVIVSGPGSRVFTFPVFLNASQELTLGQSRIVTPGSKVIPFMQVSSPDCAGSAAAGNL